MDDKGDKLSCPICERPFPKTSIQQHVDRCLFLSSSESSPSKKPRTLAPPSPLTPDVSTSSAKIFTKENTSNPSKENNAPLAERLRPKLLIDYVGQHHILGPDKVLRQLIENKNIPSMILWGPPGCGKTSLANLIAHICDQDAGLRFVKMSATMSGINDVKETVNKAKNDAKYKKKTILFMDEIHRFNKLQQDTFLPHIENGTIILIGATTENPSFSLNSALLSRCRVMVLNKHTVDDVILILKRALKTKYDCFLISGIECKSNQPSNHSYEIELQTLQWLAEMCDGDARIALNSLQIAFEMNESSVNSDAPVLISLENIQDGIKRSHLLYDRKGEEHYNIISAMHKSIRASDDNAALYWVSRMLEGGEDPLYIARRLVRVAGEDIGIADPNSINVAVACMQGCQLIGMPECDVLLAECAVYLARAPKSTEVYRALTKCRKFIADQKGAMPSVPLHLRNAPTKFMKEIGYSKGYNTLHKDKSGMVYLPEEIKDINFFQ